MRTAAVFLDKIQPKRYNMNKRTAHLVGAGRSRIKFRACEKRRCRLGDGYFFMYSRIPKMIVAINVRSAITSKIVTANHPPFKGEQPYRSLASLAKCSALELYHILPQKSSKLPSALFSRQRAFLFRRRHTVLYAFAPCERRPFLVV